MIPAGAAKGKRWRRLFWAAGLRRLGSVARQAGTVRRKKNTHKETTLVGGTRQGGTVRRKKNTHKQTTLVGGTRGTLGRGVV